MSTLNNFEQAEQIYQSVSTQIHPNVNYQIRIILWFTLVLCPLSGLLYLLSAIKRMKTNGPWLFKIDNNGLAHPNIHVVMPLWALLYTLVNFWGVCRLLRDLDSFIKPLTVALNILNYPLIFSLGWTKVWAMIYASPPSRFCLQAGRSAFLNINSRVLSPTLFNTIAIGCYIVPFVSTIPLNVFIARHVAAINTAWLSYDAASSAVLVSPSSESNQQIIVHNLLALEQHTQAIVKLNRAISGIYLFLDGFLLFTLLAASYLILRVLWFQVGLLRESAQRRRMIVLESQSIEPSNSQLSSSYPDTGPTRSLSNWTSFKDEHSHSHSQPDHFLDSKRLTFDDSWWSWLPSLKRGTEVDVDTWHSQIFHGARQEWEAIDEYILVQQYHSLRRYTSNTLWAAVLAGIIVISYLVLNWIIQKFVHFIKS
ncbi:hypothetical protein CROQUDRAFT_726397 [Cronartium quercuum f. sp. fusiforme G11]|uniref:Uncharacterized protein n=1 Tax=Cronartium quercuum f. sp. fusiforme G11 TaxID=708437 RepID=A0A9P6T5M6_9BASI|nr:hypothetical protein CROQUDRAFT_726397 [Cronartium quercuum f. sp. fusiforme G11]